MIITTLFPSVGLLGQASLTTNLASRAIAPACSEASTASLSSQASVFTRPGIFRNWGSAAWLAALLSLGSAGCGAYCDPRDASDARLDVRSDARSDARFDVLRDSQNDVRLDVARPDAGGLDARHDILPDVRPDGPRG